MDKPVYVTPEGLEKLQAEFKELKEVTIPGIANRIDEAKQLGDLSENAEYHAAKEDMAWAQGRLLEVEEKLHHAKIIEQTSSKDTVEIGGTITIETGGANRTFTIVGPTEAEPTAGKISHESPLGSAFLGKRVGDEVEVETPGGTRKYTIQNIA